MSGVALRPMKPSDVPAVADIESNVFESPWSIGILEEELVAPRRTYVVAEASGGDLVGYAGLMIVEDDAHITTIAVVPQVRGRGIATRLMLFLIEAALAGGARHLTLEVRESNAKAQRLYERFGMTTVGRRKNYYLTEDAVVMWATGIESTEYQNRLRSIGEALEATV